MKIDDKTVAVSIQLLHNYSKRVVMEEKDCAAMGVAIETMENALYEFGPMTTKRLIEYLEELPQDAIVKVYYEGSDFDLCLDDLEYDRGRKWVVIGG
jgi:hypothetical protein